MRLPIHLVKRSAGEASQLPRAEPSVRLARFSRRPKALPDSYSRYLVNSLRESFDMPGVPIRLNLRKGANPYARGSA